MYSYNGTLEVGLNSTSVSYSTIFQGIQTVNEPECYKQYYNASP